MPMTLTTTPAAYVLGTPPRLPLLAVWLDSLSRGVENLAREPSKARTHTHRERHTHTHTMTIDSGLDTGVYDTDVHRYACIRMTGSQQTNSHADILILHKCACSRKCVHAETGLRELGMNAASLGTALCRRLLGSIFGLRLQ